MNKNYQVKVATTRVETRSVVAESVESAVLSAVLGQGTYVDSDPAGVLVEAGFHGVLELWEREPDRSLVQVTAMELADIAVAMKKEHPEISGGSLIQEMGQILEGVRAKAEVMKDPVARAGAYVALDEVADQMKKRLCACVTNRIREQAGM
jgi:hypothetical protein